MNDQLYYKDLFIQLGYDVIPLRPSLKTPLCDEWQKTEIDALWSGINHEVNIGIRCGGQKQLCVIDCDNKNSPDTFDKVSDALEKFGIQISECPIVQTASGNGRHIYLISDEPLLGGYSHLSEEFGSGELRYGNGAYVVAPLSIVDGATYHLINGDFAKLPFIEIGQLSRLSKNGLGKNGPITDKGHCEKQSTQSQLEQIDSRLLPGEKDRIVISPVSRKMSNDTLARLNGNHPTVYKSRSEADMATIVALINEGYTGDEIEDMFLKFPCGEKYQSLRKKNPESASRYLRTSIENAIEFTSNHESEGRRVAREVIDILELPQMPKGLNVNTKAVLLAFATIAFESGKVEFHASVRVVAQYCGMCPQAISNNIKKLVNLGYVVVVKPAVADRATWYRLSTNLIHLLTHHL